MTANRISPLLLQPHLSRCGYTLNQNLIPNYKFDSKTVPLAGFFSRPFDTRSACLAVVEANGNGREAAASCIGLGAPTALVCNGDTVEWWRLSIEGPCERRDFRGDQLTTLFTEYGDDLSADSIYSAKLRRPLPGTQSARQLWFVDIGLMPATERRLGEALHHLVEEVIQDLAASLGGRLRSKNDYEGLYKTVFWLLAAKLLHEKGVTGFKEIDLHDVDAVFRRVGKHYQDVDDLPPGGKAWRGSIEAAASTVAGWGYLGNISTESLAYLYEKALIDKRPKSSTLRSSDARDIRKELGIHSTPPILIDHMLSQLWPLVEAHAPEDRHVFEPACGPAGFLVAAMRWLRDFTELPLGVDRHSFLRSHLHGVEVEPFAREVAKLSLTLADVPYGNSWKIDKKDMFDPGVLKRGTSQCTLLLANPPYEAFTPAERSAYKKTGQPVSAITKAVEMLNRTLPALPPGGVFGLVLPQGVLHDKESKTIRHFLAEQCELAEISLFADKLFEEAEHEVVVLIGRRRWHARDGAVPAVMYRRVRENGMAAFKESLAFSSEQQVPQARFSLAAETSFVVPELDEVWSYLSRNRRLGAVAKVGKGLEYIGEDKLPSNSWTVHEPARKGDTLGFGSVRESMVIYEPPPPVGINLSPSVIRRTGASPVKPQVLLNYARVSREPWKLKAFIDTKGHSFTSRFLQVVPRGGEFDCLVLWAILNSPVANAFTYSHSMSRDILGGMLKRLPLPDVRGGLLQRLRSAAVNYLDIVNDRGFMRPEPNEENIRAALLALDAEVLRLYDLPPRLERQVLDLFRNVERKGVGCRFTGYYPAGLTAYVPLYELISDDFQQSKAGGLRSRHRPVQAREMRAALRIAAEEFTHE